jgi:hypothetical protein
MEQVFSNQPSAFSENSTEVALFIPEIEQNPLSLLVRLTAEN